MRSCIVGRRLRPCRIARSKPIAVLQFRAAFAPVRRVTHAVTFAARQCHRCLLRTPHPGEEKSPSRAVPGSLPTGAGRGSPTRRATFLRGRSRDDRAGQRAAPPHSTPAREMRSIAALSNCQFADVISCASRDDEKIRFDAACAAIFYGIAVWSAVGSTVSGAATSCWMRRASTASGTISLWHAWRPSVTGRVPRRASSAWPSALTPGLRAARRSGWNAASLPLANC